jgi:hypothetical protein
MNKKRVSLATVFLLVQFTYNFTKKFKNKIKYYFPSINHARALNKSIITNYSSYLEYGKYCIDAQKSIITKHGQRYKPITFLSETKKSRRNLIWDKLFFLFASVKNKDKRNLFDGVSVICSHSKKIKIISNKSKQVYTFFPNIDDYNFYKHNHEMLSKFFRTIPILNSFEDQKLIIEKFVETIPCDTIRIFDNFLIDVSDYLSKCKTIKILFEKDDEKKYLNMIQKYSINKDLSEETLEYLKNKKGRIITFTHGDLHKLNVLYTNEGFYYIDFELGANHVFYFDIFYYMYIEAFKFNNDMFLDKYFKGDYDKIIFEIFKKVGEVYNKNKKKVYLLVTLFEEYKRWGLYPKNVINKFLK